jgi:hypothetical protein
MSTPQLDPRFANARASVVNRTHRVIRAEALTMQEQKQKKRSLWAPIAIVSALLLVCCYAMWSILGAYDITPNGVPDASDQLLILLLWSLPVTLLILGAVWFKRGRGRSNNGEVPR